MMTEINSSAGNRFVLVCLLTIFAVCSMVLIAADHYSRNRIAQNARDAELRIIDAVMPLAHDNDLHADYLAIDATALAGTVPVMIFRARQTGRPRGVAFMPVTAAGYSGAIRLAIGIAYDGTVLGVRVIQHRETPGLGDRIETAKSSWITLFTGRSFANTPVTDWTVQAEGGTFDQLSGATITSRGMVNAVRKTLEYYTANRDRLYLEHPQPLSP